MLKKTLAIFVILSLGVLPALADFRISQRTTIEGMSMEVSIWVKGVRERREQKLAMGGDMDGLDMSMVESMMPPNFTTISQCDLKQNVSLNPKSKSYFIDYYDWSTVPPETLKRRPNQKVVIKGTTTVSSVVTDSGKRQPMFGFTARWLKAVQTVENSADSCDGAASIRTETEGWFIDLSLERDRCLTQIAGEKGGCRPRLNIKSAQYPGFFLKGTIKMFDNNKLQTTTEIDTTALSKETLDQALFEVPTGWTEVDSFAELMQATRPADTSAVTVIDGKQTAAKTVAIDFFSGSTSKLDQNELRGYISSKLSAAGLSGYSVMSQSEIAAGNFVNVIGVEIKKVKESGASKVGGLFGKVTGVDSASKAGESEAEIIVSAYTKDGKTVVVSVPATEKVSGNAQAAVKAAIDKAMPSIIAKIK